MQGFNHIRAALSSNIVNLDGIALAYSNCLEGWPSFTSIIKSLFSGCLIRLKTLFSLTRVEQFVHWKDPKIRDHSTSSPASLHWLPVKSRVQLKILALTFKTIHGQSPSYLKEVMLPYHPPKTLQSQDAGLFMIQIISKHRMGGRAFRLKIPSVEISSRLGTGGRLSRSMFKNFLVDKVYS